MYNPLAPHAKKAVFSSELNTKSKWSLFPVYAAFGPVAKSDIFVGLERFESSYIIKPS